MSNQLYVRFKRLENYSVSGDLLLDSWVAEVSDDHTVHDFDYETFDEMREHWEPENVIQNLKDFEVLDEFEIVLKHNEGFYYPSESLMSTWIKIDLKELETVEDE